jgi:hypothetical protein
VQDRSLAATDLGAVQAETENGERHEETRQHDAPAGIAWRCLVPSRALPDGDALALTFAYPVAKKDWAEEGRFEDGLQRLKRWVRCVGVRPRMH